MSTPVGGRGSGVHCVRTDTGALTPLARWWAAVLEGGSAGVPRRGDGAAGRGARALRARRRCGCRCRGAPGSVIAAAGSTSGRRAAGRSTTSWVPGSRAPGRPWPPSGPPCGRGPTARRRCCSRWWCSSGWRTVADLAAELLRVRRDRRRALIQEVLLDLVGGIGSLGELDVLRGCRERGIPEPDSQVLRRTSNGTYYLDFRWRRWRLVLEIDGIQHAWAEQIVAGRPPSERGRPRRRHGAPPPGAGPPALPRRVLRPDRRGAAACRL